MLARSQCRQQQRRRRAQRATSRSRSSSSARQRGARAGVEVAPHDGVDGLVAALTAELHGRAQYALETQSDLLGGAPTLGVLREIGA